MVPPTDATILHEVDSLCALAVRIAKQRSDAPTLLIVPTTYPDWHVDQAREAGASVVIYANQGLRATVTTPRTTFRAIVAQGRSSDLEASIASVSDVFSLQRLAEWRRLEAQEASWPTA